jgi:hypothetical protein
MTGHQITQCQVEHEKLCGLIINLCDLVREQNELIKGQNELIRGQYMQLITQAAGIVPGGMVPMRTYLITTIVSFGIGNISGGGELLKIILGGQ